MARHNAGDADPPGSPALPPGQVKFAPNETLVPAPPPPPPAMPMYAPARGPDTQYADAALPPAPDAEVAPHAPAPAPPPWNATANALPTATGKETLNIAPLPP